jgi:NAD(P)-dependent dehydrogenase (short-subunit alcohol dehydrogenase family)
MAIGTVLVTGGSRGIGAAICRSAARAGYRVAVNFMNSKVHADELVGEIRGGGGEAMAVKADVSNEGEIVRMFEIVDNNFGKVSHLVNNAGQSSDFRVESATTGDIAKVMDLNFLSTVVCCREAIARMSKERGGDGGVIVNISSRAAVLGGLPGRTIYAAAKGAVDSFTIGFAKEVGPAGIRVNGLRPGPTLTETHNGRGGKVLLERIMKDTAIGRPGRPDEIASAVLFLMSDASSYMSGTVIDVSGGR